MPVQSGRGLRMAGTGSAPEKESRCITRFITMSRSRKVSRLARVRVRVRGRGRGRVRVRVRVRVEPRSLALTLTLSLTW